jgi:hypothetical protein
MVFDVFGNTIHPKLRLVDFDLRVRTGNGIDFSSLLLLLENRPLTNTHRQLHRLTLTFKSLLAVCGDSNFSLNLLFSIMSSKSMSTFLPLWALRTFRSYFSRLASSIFSRRSYRFFSICLICSRWVFFLSPPRIQIWIIRNRFYHYRSAHSLT